MSQVRKKLELLIGRLMVRLLASADFYRSNLQRVAIQRSYISHPTANVAAARFANGRGVPEDITIGEESAIQGELIIFPQGGKIAIGRKSFVGRNSKIWSSASVTIGNYVLISHDVNIHDNNSHPINLADRRTDLDALLPDLKLRPHDFDLKAAPIIIEDDVWIGFGASVFGGVRIGRGAIVGAGTMVTKDVPPLTVVVGNPMRIVRQLDGGEADHAG